jgi:hypothetical protein
MSVTSWAADATGKQQVRITTADGVITGMASPTQSDEGIAGWVGPEEIDPIPVDGAISGDKVVLRTHPQPGRTVAFSCDLAPAGEKMTGRIDADQGRIEFQRSKQ